MTATQRDPAGCGPREGGAHLAFAPILEGCRPLFPRELLDTGGWERLLDRARLLPRSVLDAHFGFEFHLGEPSPDADLFVVVRPGSDLSRHCIGEGARSEPGSAAIRYALRMSTFASRVPQPSCLTNFTAVSTETYVSEHRDLLIPSFTLWPAGDERSTMRCHCPGVSFGTTPKRLT